MGSSWQAQAKREKEAAAAAAERQAEVQSLLCLPTACVRHACARGCAGQCAAVGHGAIKPLQRCTQAARTLHSMHERSNPTGVCSFVYFRFLRFTTECVEAVSVLAF
jgi:hypothetical protein